LKFAIELQAVYLRGTTYLRTPLFGIIPVVTLFVVCAGAVDETLLIIDQTGREMKATTQKNDSTTCDCDCQFNNFLATVVVISQSNIKNVTKCPW